MKESPATNGTAASQKGRSGVIQVVSEPKKKEEIILDTSILVHDPKCFQTLREEEEESQQVVPWVVTEEIDELKTRADIGWDAREVARQLELDQLNGGLVRIHDIPKKGIRGLSRKKADYEIIATGLECKGKLRGGKDVLLMSLDTNMRIWARKCGLPADGYPYTQVDATFDSNLKRIHLPAEKYFERKEGSSFFKFDLSNMDNLVLNEGVICTDNGNDGDDESESLLAIYKGDERFRLVENERCILGLRPFTLEDSMNGVIASKPILAASKKERKRNRKQEILKQREMDFPPSNRKNWQQYLAFEQLLDPEVELVFLQGGAGTGKTLIATASSIFQRERYEHIIIVRPAVHLEDHDSHGFLPGTLEAKINPWLAPIKQAYSYLFKVDPKLKSIIKEMERTEKITYQSLDYIRGQTFHRSLIVIDEAQNLTPHQVKTIVTRAGLGTKMIFTGDLGQIDRSRRLDRRNSGLAYAMKRMANKPTIASINFKETVRSLLASMGEELL